jgi:magnesium transporter
MINPILLPEIRLMLAEKDEQGLVALTTELHPASVADFTEGLTVEETWEVLSHAPLAKQAEIFSYYSNTKQEQMVLGAGRQRMSALLEEMAPDNRVDLLKRLDPAVVEELLPLMAKAERHDIVTLLSYPQHSAGSVMTTEYASIPADMTAAEAINLLRVEAPDSEMIYYIYVLGPERHLMGFVSLRDLILAKPGTKVSDLMERDVISARVDEDQEEVAQRMARYDFLALPVVDGTGRLVGIVTHDDVIDVMVEEATEDVHRLGGVSPVGGAYLETGFARLWYSRAIWLSILFVAQLLTFNVMAGYEDILHSVTVLALFVPLVISTGGNSGSQAATLITRALALGQVSPAQWARVLRHELLMGVALGVTLGVIALLRATIIRENTLEGFDRWTLALIISQSVAAVCLWGTLVGAMLPMLIKKLGFDPALASSPFVATSVDVTGLVVYFSIAQLYFNFG